MKGINRGEVFSKIISFISCDVKDFSGKHCPGLVEYRVLTNKGEAYLCADCLRNIRGGAYKDIIIKTIEEKL